VTEIAVNIAAISTDNSLNIVNSNIILK
jgi:hypothetical protein